MAKQRSQWIDRQLEIDTTAYGQLAVSRNQQGVHLWTAVEKSDGVPPSSAGVSVISLKEADAWEVEECVLGPLFAHPLPWKLTAP